MHFVALQEFTHRRLTFRPGDALPARASRWVDIREFERRKLVARSGEIAAPDTAPKKKPRAPKKKAS